jgi:hypothetical protein
MIAMDHNKPYRAFSFTIALAIALYFLTIGLHLNSLSNIFAIHWQFLDLPELLRSPFLSLLHLHSQPPLLNLLTWALASVPGDLYSNFIFVNALCVSASCTLSYIILRGYFTNRTIPFLVSLLLLLTPATLLNISYPFYPCLTLFGYTLFVFSFWLKAEKRALKFYLFFFSVLYLSLLRSSFSLFHVIFYIAVYAAYHKDHVLKNRRIILGLSVLLISTTIIPFKNYWLYGFFGSSSWAPINIARGVGVQLDLGMFPSPESIAKERPDLKCTHRYGVQDTALIKANGQPNYNSCYMVAYAPEAAEQFKSRYSLKRHLYRIATHSIQYFCAPEKYDFLTNRDQIQSYTKIVQYLFLTLKWDERHETRFLILFFILIGFFGAIVKRDRFLMLCMLVISCHFLGQVLTDGDEGKRFVFEIEFLFPLVAAIAYANLKGVITNPKTLVASQGV